jgi:hypothetical protein
LSDYGQERQDEKGGHHFNVMRWTQEGTRWFKKEMERTPLQSWPAERRALLKKDLRPLVELYQQL